MMAFLLLEVKIIGRLIVLKRLVESSALRMMSKDLPMAMMPPTPVKFDDRDAGGQRGEGVEGGSRAAAAGGAARGRVGLVVLVTPW